MARLAALATGNFATLGTWGTVDATSLADGESAAHTVTTAFSGTRTVAFTPGAITVAGIALKLNNRTGTTGTISARLSLSATHVAVAGTTVTINTADLPAAIASDNNGGWIYFEFATPVTLAAATGYEVEVSTSSSATVNLWRFNATAQNVSRMLVTTTNPGSLAAGDTFHIMKRYTGTGASTAVTVTMDNTATTDFGAGTDNVVALTISGATLAYAAAAATNYYLKLSGDLIVYAGGALNIGSSGTPIPSDSTAVLEFDPVADGGMGLIFRNLSSSTMYGGAKTAWVLLASDAAVAATSLTTNVAPTGWKNGDVIAIEPTTRTSTQFEAKALTADASGTSLTITALTYAHDGGNGGARGASDAAALGNLTRNIKVRSASSTIMAYVLVGTTPTINWSYVEFYYLGENVANKQGIYLSTTTGTVSMVGCTVHDIEDGGVQSVGSSGSGTVLLDECVFYNLNSSPATAVNGILVSAGPTVTISDCMLTGVGGTQSSGIFLNNWKHSITNTRVSGVAGNSSAGGIRGGSSSSLAGTYSDIVVHSNAGAGLFFSGTMVNGLTFTNTSLWRNGGNGLQLSASSMPSTLDPATFDGMTVFGNASAQLSITNTNAQPIVVRDALVDTEASYTAAVGVQVGGHGIIMMYDCEVGVVGTHSTADFQGGGVTVSPRTFLYNCRMGSATEVTSMGYLGFIRSQRHDQSSTTHKTFSGAGRVEAETTTRHTASGYAWKATPLNSTLRLVVPGPNIVDAFRVPWKGGVQCTVSVWVRKDSAYNGLTPRLVMVGGKVQGIASDVIDSLTVAHSTWEQLSVTATPTEDCVIEFYVDCSGTAGAIYIDDITVA